MTDQKRHLADRLAAVRTKTLWLMEQVPDEFWNVRVHSFYSPIGWHFGHVGRTEEHWTACRALGLAPVDADLEFLYTDRPENPKDNRVNVPDRATTFAYLEQTRDATLAALDAADLAAHDPILHDGYAWEFAAQHESQHQETICEMLHLIQRQRPGPHPDGVPWVAGVRREWIEVAGGTFTMGTDDRLVYDNEQPAHLSSVADFRLDQHAVTCHEWSEFIARGGYHDPRVWTAEGWAWRCENAIERPFYWLEDSAHLSISASGVRPLHPDEPVLGISWYEADAFARAAGARLPTEAEWEFAASNRGLNAFPWGDEPATAATACFGVEPWHPAAPSRRTSQLRIEDLAGNAWEWCATTFDPYPGFAAYPYDGYSKDHMDGGHYVCRGGSWATSAEILRRTFRNWYVPTYRQGFIGLRLAADGLGPV